MAFAKSPEVSGPWLLMGNSKWGAAAALSPRRCSTRDRAAEFIPKSQSCTCAPLYTSLSPLGEKWEDWMRCSLKSLLGEVISLCLLRGISDHGTESWERPWGMASPMIFHTLRGRGQRGLSQGLTCNEPVGCKGPWVLHNCPLTPQGSHPVYPPCR